MRRNGGMGRRETRKGLTSFRSLLLPSLSNPSASSLAPSPFSFESLSSAHPFLSALCLRSLPRLYLRSIHRQASMLPALSLFPSLSLSLFSYPPFIIHRPGKFIYVLRPAVILNSRFTIPRLSPFFPQACACLMSADLLFLRNDFTPVSAFDLENRLSTPSAATKFLYKTIDSGNDD